MENFYFIMAGISVIPMLFLLLFEHNGGPGGGGAIFLLIFWPIIWIIFFIRIVDIAKRYPYWKGLSEKEKAAFNNSYLNYYHYIS